MKYTCRTLSNKSLHPPEHRASTIRNNSEVPIPNFDPKVEHNPPPLLRLRGKDLCGDILLRCRSKLVVKKWKALFFHIHGDTLLFYSSSNDWMCERDDLYFTKKIDAYMQVFEVPPSDYKGVNIPLPMCNVYSTNMSFYIDSYVHSQDIRE